MRKPTPLLVYIIAVPAAVTLAVLFGWVAVWVILPFLAGIGVGLRLR